MRDENDLVRNRRREIKNEKCFLMKRDEMDDLLDPGEWTVSGGGTPGSIQQDDPCQMVLCGQGLRSCSCRSLKLGGQ